MTLLGLQKAFEGPEDTVCSSGGQTVTAVMGSLKILPFALWCPLDPPLDTPLLRGTCS